jgi:uncharacterized damage-inducible protein DinB
LACGAVPPLIPSWGSNRPAKEMVRVNAVLLEAFRFNGWATKHLIAACRDLPDERLTAPASASYGSILETFNHIVRSDASYLRRLAGGGPDWVDNRDLVDLDELARRVDQTHELWARLLAEPIDAERVFIVDDGAYAVRAGVIAAQALHHGNAHREQICAILTGFGLEPPDVQPWEYSWATGRIWERTEAERAADG